MHVTGVRVTCNWTDTCECGVTTGAVDLEALVVQPGRWAWSIRVDVHVLDHGGSAASAASVAVRLPSATPGYDVS